MVLGAVMGGDLQQWQQKQWLTYSVRELSQHAVAIGASGSRKTETLLRIAALAAEVYGWQVVYLDAKGEEQTAMRFFAAMHRAQCRTVLYFPRQRYDGWRGDARAIVNRLHALQTFSEPYYSDVAMQVLTLAVKAPSGIPRSSAELAAKLGEYTEAGISTLYLVHYSVLASLTEGTEVRVPAWVLALHALYRGRVYVYRDDGAIVPVLRQNEWGSGPALRRLKMTRRVQVGMPLLSLELCCSLIACQYGALAGGEYLVAMGGDGVFWG